MFDFDAGKLLIIGIVALVFIPSKDLPRVLRQLGQFVGKMRRMASEFQGQFMDAMREADMAELRREAEKLSKAAEVDVSLHPVRDLNTHINGLIDGKPALTASDANRLGMASETPSIAPPGLVAHGEAEGAMVEETAPASVVVDPGHGIEPRTSAEAPREPVNVPRMQPASGGA